MRLTIFRLVYFGVPGPGEGGGSIDAIDMKLGVFVQHYYLINNNRTHFSQKSVFLVFSSYICAEGQHSQILMIENT